MASPMTNSQQYRYQSNNFVCVESKIYRLFKRIKRGKEVIDIMVENALLKSAMGYRYDEVVKERIYNPETGESEIVEVKRTTKDVAPNSTSLIFWLKNRRPADWRDTKNIDAAVEVKNPFDGIDTADIKKLIGDD